MEYLGISHNDVWEEAIVRTHESLQKLRDYVHGVRLGIGDPSDVDLAEWRDLDLTKQPSDTVDDAMDMAEMMLASLQCELQGVSPIEARDEIITMMRDNLRARLFEGQSHISYQLCNDVIEVLAQHYNATCIERKVPAQAFLQQQIFGAAEQYADISRSTLQAMTGRVKTIMMHEGMEDTGIVTPYEFAAERHRLHKNPAANDDDGSFEDEMKIQHTARNVMGCAVDGFYPVPFDKMCPEMTLIVESLAGYRSQRNVPYRAPSSEEAISEAVSRDFGRIYRACPNMHDDIGQLLQAVGRVNHFIGAAVSAPARL